MQPSCCGHGSGRLRADRGRAALARGGKRRADRPRLIREADDRGTSARPRRERGAREPVGRRGARSCSLLIDAFELSLGEVAERWDDRSPPSRTSSGCSSSPMTCSPWSSAAGSAGATLARCWRCRPGRPAPAGTEDRRRGCPFVLPSGRRVVQGRARSRARRRRLTARGPGRAGLARSPAQVRVAAGRSRSPGREHQLEELAES